ncbi:MAG TPA: acetyl-CoA carboxylase carboxyltransferase subunit beta, partial [Alphaproteobacteria bacterium]|nr:acetyl-CoA carboxylase carboxyltransferase subunit beta [Alphaproteobacteria bacterium]
MSWLDRFARPKVRGLFRKDDIPQDLWEKCPNCEQMIFHRELENNQRVCPHCDHHLRLDARKRLTYLFDDGEFQTIELPEAAADPLRFRDRKRYQDRLRDARSETNQDAVIVAHGTLGGHSAVVAAFDFAFLGGSMGVAVGEALLAGARLAVLQDSAFIVVPASGGARMQEGTLSLMQMARTTVAVDELK